MQRNSFKKLPHTYPSPTHKKKLNKKYAAGSYEFMLI